MVIMVLQWVLFLLCMFQLGTFYWKQKTKDPVLISYWVILAAYWLINFLVSFSKH